MANFKEIISITLILFSVIDIIGNIPVVIELRKREGHVKSLQATIVSGILMIAFLFVGPLILKLFGLDIESFAIAGSIIILILSMEMILGRKFFKEDPDGVGSGSIVPLAFPLISGAGTLTTILSIRSVYSVTNILIAIVINLVIVFVVLKSTGYLERKLGRSGFAVLRRVFGIILLAIGVKILKTYIAI